MKQNQNNTAQTSPFEAMIQLMSGFWVSRGIYVAAKLGIADYLRDGDKTAAELAAATDTHADSLYRVLRMLAMVGVFEQKGDDRFALTPLSETLLTDSPFSLRAGAIAEMGEVHYEAWGNIMHSVKTGEIAFDNNFGMNIWQYFETDREKAQNFNKYMASSSESVSQAIVEAYNFSESQKLVDVGGGLGGMISAILRANPNLSGVLFDAPSVVEKAREFLINAGVSERCETIGGDFFESVPAGGDVYTLRWIIHDWEDGLSIKILKNIRNVLPPNGKLLLFEAVVPQNGQPHFSKFMDLIMLTMTGGRERTAEEYESLLGKADFKVTRVIPTASFMSIVEAVPA
jgi:ubiquinone/menaquinone biosynthesis C-methylase UbiE